MEERAFAYAPPAVQFMSMHLESIPGVVIKQVTQFTEAVVQAIGVPYEKANLYRVSALPSGIHAARSPDQPGRWVPLAAELDTLPEQIQVWEESSCVLRAILTVVGGLNLRCLTLHFMEGGHERLQAQRPCRLGGCVGCPLLLRVTHNGVLVGEVKEDWDNYCWSLNQCCCLCTFNTKVWEQTPAMNRGQLVHMYTLKTSLCCCGRVNNCCGATCCKSDLIIDVLDKRGELVATIQKTYGRTDKSNCGACCRSANEYDTYILEFPTRSTAQQRALLMTALLSVDYQLFEETGGNMGGG